MIRLYVKQMRYFYQEIAGFCGVVFIVCLPALRTSFKVAFCLMAWGGFLVWRGHHFNLFVPAKEKINDYLKKFEACRSTFAKKSEENSQTPDNRKE